MIQWPDGDPRWGVGPEKYPIGGCRPVDFPPSGDTRPRTPEAPLVVPCKHCKGRGSVFRYGSNCGYDPCTGCKGAGVHRL